MSQEGHSEVQEQKTPICMSDWDIVVFKVEDTLFRGFRKRFVECSDVFEGMFLVPPERSGEGSSDEHPIVLHGYKKEDFAALMKILFPKTQDVVSGEFSLTKEEWVGVLRLSTMWEMKTNRELAIKYLSSAKMNVPPVEMVAIAREFKVGKWFQESLTEIVRGSSRPPLELLIQTLGLPSACRIINLQSKFSLIGIISCRPGGIGAVSSDWDPSVFTSVGALKCERCREPAFKEPVICTVQACRRTHDLHGAQSDTLYCPQSKWSVVSSVSGGRVGLEVNAELLGCVYCELQFLPHSGVPCANCGTERGRETFFIGYTLEQVKKAITEAFQDELGEYTTEEV